MITRLLSALCLLSLLTQCNKATEQGPTDFLKLPEEEKRKPQHALAAMTVLPGQQVALFASEPMVTNPTNISVDSKGRVWVCEAYNYDLPSEQEDKKGDRIVVLEDTDNDGQADKRTVFYQGEDITTPLGILALDDKVYVSRSPNLYVFTDTNGDLVADKKDTLFTNMGRRGDHSAHAMFPGPDGRFYFSTGNMAGDMQDPEGKQVVDKAGFEVTQKGNPYLGGMVMRFTPDGKNMEVLGHNFRNNYEPCIDSYGNVWQSDNDDDGNESCRINFVMPYGNYGYLDEFTRASWGAHRVGMEEEIPERHWHQHDPGVVPNVLITGAGSPAGMVMYEGDLLPEPFFGAPVHAEPYYNVVRAYLPQPRGAGYEVSVKDILKSADQWFRPVDVAVAPDGSLMIADWYDPVLGGGAAGDAARGRIYRVAPDARRYQFSPADLSTVDGAVAALKSPNPETRYAGWRSLHAAGDKAVPALQALWTSPRPYLRARALWLLSQTSVADNVLRQALSDNNADIRITGVRAAAQTQTEPLRYLDLVKNDSSPAVRREVATSLRYDSATAAAAIWSTLAQAYDGNDPWYLEALGIGADLHADLFFDTWRRTAPLDLKKPAHRDIVWRMRAGNALPLLATLIRSTPDIKETQRYFRAFDFHRDKRKNDILLSLLNLSRPDSKAVSALALRQMNSDQVRMTPALRKALEEALAYTKGTMAYINMVEKFHLKEKMADLLTLATKEGGSETGAAATALLIRWQASGLLAHALNGDDASATSLLQSMRGKGSSDITALVQSVVRDTARSLAVRQTAVQVLGSSWPGEERLLEIVKSKTFSEALKPAAAGVLFNVYRSEIQREAAQYLPAPATKGSHLPPIKQLLAASGDAEKGKAVFTTYCSTCHRASETGVKFGPELSQIGSKLSPEGLYRAIIYPDEGVSYGYEGYLIAYQGNNKAMGIIASETDRELELLQPGGASPSQTSQPKPATTSR